MNTFNTELQLTSDSFKEKQKVFFSGSKFSQWYRNTKSYKSFFYDKYPFYIKGEVVYACLVQANTLLFKKQPAINCPAAIIFSYDDYYKNNPAELLKISRLLFSFKNKPNPNEDIKLITDAITDEYKKYFNVPIPSYITEGRQVFYTTIMVYRLHLPQGRIVGPIFPIVSDPSRPKETYIVPKECWTVPLKNFFLKKTTLLTDEESSRKNLQ